MNVRNRKMREKMNMRLPKTVNELYTLVDKFARAEEGRRLPGEEVGIEIDLEDDDDATTLRKKKKEVQQEAQREICDGR